MRVLLAASLLAGLASIAAAQAAAPKTVVKVRALAPTNSLLTAEAVASGTLDDRLSSHSPSGAGPHPLALSLLAQGKSRKDPPRADGSPVVVMNATRGLSAQLLTYRSSVVVALPFVTKLPGFLGTRDLVVKLLPEGVSPAQPLYVHVVADSSQEQFLSFSVGELGSTLTQWSGARARMIALTFGALLAVSVAALLIGFVLKDRLLILYATMFFLQALYVAYLTGQGFDWPLLSYAVPLDSLAWNVPVGLSGAVACLFTREIADLRSASIRHRIYRAFRLACHRIRGHRSGQRRQVCRPGGVGERHRRRHVRDCADIHRDRVFSLLAARQSRGRLVSHRLVSAGRIHHRCGAAILGDIGYGLRGPVLHFGLPLSMVAASILTALGVADRVRAQRAALSEAERRAQTDPLTGVLNRRSLIERLEAACARAKARGLPIALLFIDLDHFKQINDTFGHQAGDACLRAIVGPIHAELRQSDVIGRYGGEEFVVILSSADAAAASPIAQRILERVADVRVDGFGMPITVTCSIGIATSDTLGMWGEKLLAHADAAVYVAKRSGRNQIHMAAAPVAA